MICVQYTRGAGMGLTYDIEVMQDGSYVISIAGVVLRGGLPDPLNSRDRWWCSGSSTRGLERSKRDIELLTNMPEQAPPAGHFVRQKVVVRRLKAGAGQ